MPKIKTETTNKLSKLEIHGLQRKMRSLGRLNEINSKLMNPIYLAIGFLGIKSNKFLIKFKFVNIEMIIFLQPRKASRMTVQFYRSKSVRRVITHLASLRFARV